jgi:hypothetical protein
LYDVGRAGAGDVQRDGHLRRRHELQREHGEHQLHDHQGGDVDGGVGEPDVDELQECGDAIGDGPAQWGDRNRNVHIGRFDAMFGFGLVGISIVHDVGELGAGNVQRDGHLWRRHELQREHGDHQLHDHQGGDVDDGYLIAEPGGPRSANNLHGHGEPESGKWHRDVHR